MLLQRTTHFRRAYRKLTADEQRQVDAHLLLLAENPRHPSLRAARCPGSNEWYARVSQDIRMFYEVHEGYYLLTDVGHHDIEREH